MGVLCADVMRGRPGGEVLDMADFMAHSTFNADHSTVANRSEPTAQTEASAAQEDTSPAILHPLDALRKIIANNLI